jgi:hypothetical protein
MGLTEESEIAAYADFVAETTQSMYDQYTRNIMSSSPGLRALAPMQAYVFTAYSNVWDIANMTGVDKSRKQRAIELLEWKVAATLWDAMWSMIMGDDPLKALFNPGMDKDVLTSHVPVLPSAAQFLGINIDDLYVERWNMVMPERFEKATTEWKKDPVQQFLERTGRAFGPDTTHARNKEIALWANDYILPHAGIPATRITHNFIQMVDASINNGRIHGSTGRFNSYIEGLDRQGPLRETLTFVVGSIFGTKAVDERKNLDSK